MKVDGSTAKRNRSLKGQRAYQSGLAAEQSVARQYAEQGYEIVAERWGCTYGEIDLIAQRGAEYVFVEVKTSQTFETAARAITPRQQERIFAAATLFATELPTGLLTPMRFDAALVDGMGRIEIRANALSTS
ncbi:MAG: YraN family protein [Pseudomonadota bacterium]